MRSPSNAVERPVTERPAIEIGFDAVPNFGEAFRLEEKEEDNTNPDGADLHTEYCRPEPPVPGHVGEQIVDAVGKKRDENRAQQASQNRPHSADDDHCDVDDREIHVYFSTVTT